MTGAFDDLVARAKERAEESPIPDGWGYRIQLEENDSFVGRWRGETKDEQNVDNKGNPRRIFLFWDADDVLCFSRSYAALDREIDREPPELGCTIAIHRGADYQGQQGTGFAFGVVTEANEAPLPEEPALAESRDIPF